MFGDSFFTKTLGRSKKSRIVFVPMYGDSFFTINSLKRTSLGDLPCFRPHVWGFFFHTRYEVLCVWKGAGVFVPMFGDSFFTRRRRRGFLKNGNEVFVPMCGNSFFTTKNVALVIKDMAVFVPMFGDSFFTAGLGDPTGWALYCPFAAGISN